MDEAALLAPAARARYLPAGERVHVLVTTRLEPDRLPGVDCVPLDRLPEQDARRLLEKYRPPQGEEEGTAASKIVQRLGGHALAVEVVAVFLWKNPGISYRDYLTRLEQEGLAAVEGAGQDPLVTLSRHARNSSGRCWRRHSTRSRPWSGARWSMLRCLLRITFPCRGCARW